MTVPQVNARLFKVAGEALTEELDRPESDTMKWEGDVGIYYQEQLRRTAGAQADDRVTRTIFTLPDVPAVEVEARDVLTFARVRSGGAVDPSQSGTVVSTQVRELPGEPVIPSRRISLEER